MRVQPLAEGLDERQAEATYACVIGMCKLKMLKILYSRVPYWLACKESEVVVDEVADLVEGVREYGRPGERAPPAGLVFHQAVLRDRDRGGVDRV